MLCECVKGSVSATSYCRSCDELHQSSDELLPSRCFFHRIPHTASLTAYVSHVLKKQALTAVVGRLNTNKKVAQATKKKWRVTVVEGQAAMLIFAVRGRDIEQALELLRSESLPPPLPHLASIKPLSTLS